MLAIFETHPVQYRGPLYRELQRLAPDQFHVFYATDVSVRGYRDAEFGKSVVWDVPLLEGYPNTILNLERGEPLKGFRSLHGRGIGETLSRYSPAAVLQTQFLYEYDICVLLQACMRGIPVWMRQETQDKAYRRSASKELLRYAIYRALYAPVQKAFYMGELNRRHLVRHGLKAGKLVSTPYCTPDRFSSATTEEISCVREGLRTKLQIESDTLVIGFFGKLIPKKNPELLFESVAFLPDSIRKKILLLFVGSGALESRLKESAAKVGVKTLFAGFVNQTAIADYYAATDVLVLPSRQEGETWGLVINEALQAGCGVIMTDAVGCHLEFGSWERVRVISVGDAEALARGITELSAFPRSFDWARPKLEPYQPAAVAQALAAEIRLLRN